MITIDEGVELEPGTFVVVNCHEAPCYLVLTGVCKKNGSNGVMLAVTNYNETEFSVRVREFIFSRTDAEMNTIL